MGNILDECHFHIRLTIFAPNWSDSIIGNILDECHFHIRLTISLPTGVIQPSYLCLRKHFLAIYCALIYHLHLTAFLPHELIPPFSSNINFSTFSSSTFKSLQLLTKIFFSAIYAFMKHLYQCLFIMDFLLDSRNESSEGFKSEDWLGEHVNEFSSANM